MTQMSVQSTADAALARLRALTGREDAQFHPGQFEAISALVDYRRRALVVQRTGWGKSAVYFVATALLREKGAGPTVLVSPLLALMRDQVAAAERAGVRAAAINSATVDDWTEIESRLADDSIDIPVAHPRGDFVHWAVVDIPAAVHAIAAGSCSDGISPRGKPAGSDAGGRRGLNDYSGWFAGNAAMGGDYFGYDGPYPPPHDAQ